MLNFNVGELWQLVSYVLNAAQFVVISSRF